MKGIATLTQMEEDLIFNEARDPGDPKQNTNGGMVELGVEHVQARGELMEQLDLPGDDLNLVSIPLQFTSHCLFTARETVRRGRKPGGGLQGRPRKRPREFTSSIMIKPCIKPTSTVKFKECPTQRRFTGFYGNPDVARRKETWNLLRNLAKVSMRPWFCGGDFNEILVQHEKQGTLSRAQWQINAFRACLSDCGLQDLGFEINIFTWSNHKEAPYTVRARFD
ncbi:UNVERIFIED_CONTAM: hypothetical protein Sangu_0395800 [Sesamum angustifolium]|uniref:Uncharacterized protein n=1 Tax=Sesamum angustifolium TaxID=2727405 RepID=A0AAW2QSS0_9LAMI